MQGRNDMSKAQLERVRLQAVPLFQAGLEDWEIADRLGFERSTVTRWHIRYRQGGVGALKARPDKGKAPRLTPAQVEAVTRATHGKTLKLAQIAAWIYDQWGVRLGKTRIHALAHKHGWAQYA